MGKITELRFWQSEFQTNKMEKTFYLEQCWYENAFNYLYNSVNKIDPKQAFSTIEI